MQTSKGNPTYVLAVLAPTLAGCGTLWLEDLHATMHVHEPGTLHVEAHATAQTEGGLEIVEQAPAQVFVVEAREPELERASTAGAGECVGPECVNACVEGACEPCAGESCSGAGAGTGASIGLAASTAASAGASAAVSWNEVGVVVSDGGASGHAGAGSSRVSEGAAPSTSRSASGAGAGASRTSASGRELGIVVAHGGASGPAGASGGRAVSATGTSGRSGAIAAAGEAAPPSGTSPTESAQTSSGRSAIGMAGATSTGALERTGASEIAGSGTQASTVEARASVPRSGVWSLDGRPTALTALAGPGVQVDGVRVALDELDALAGVLVAPAPSAQLPTDGAIDAWAHLEHDTLARSGGETHVVVHLRARPDELPRSRLRVHLVIDRSSSMQRSWDRVLAAARLLVARLHADDELQIVAYGTEAIEAFPIGRVGDGRAAIAALEGVAVGGGTNIEAGLRRAYAAAASANPSARSLVILLSDGVPTRGAFDPAELHALAAGARARGCTTSVIGLGVDFDPALLRAVARGGHGTYHVSANLDALATGLVGELERHARAAARDLRVRVMAAEGVEIAGIDAGEAERVSGGVLLATPHLDAGEERRIVLRVRVPAGTRARDVARVTLEYRSGIDGRAVSASRALDVSFGARPALSGEGLAGLGVLDASLAAALDAAGAAIARGDGVAAKRALEEHAAFAEGRVEHRRSTALQARARVVRRLAEAIHALVPSATHPQRRQIANAFGELAVRFGR